MTARQAAPKLDLSLRLVREVPYELHEVIVRRPSGRYQPCGAYAIKRDSGDWATAGKGQWWVGISWLDVPEHGPYASFPSARKALVTDQVLTPVLVERGWHR